MMPPNPVSKYIYHEIDCAVYRTRNNVYRTFNLSTKCEYVLYNTHTRLTAFFRDYPGEPVPER